MADVFISYASEDWPLAHALADGLRKLGLDVWWDEDLVGGQGFREPLIEQLQLATAVIVIWSTDAAQSQWVLGEADEARRLGKLIATRSPRFDPAQIPLDFRGEQTDEVTDLAKIVRALEEKKVFADSVDATATGTAFAARMAAAIERQAEEAAPRISYFLPLIVLTLGMIVGVGLLVVANFLGIGWVEWMPTVLGGSPWPEAKQVGYIPAVNWTITTMVIVPLALALVLLAGQTLTDIRHRMVARRMIVSRDFEPITDDDRRLRRMWRDIRRITRAFIFVVTTFVLALALLDYHSVVGSVYDDPEIRSEINTIGPGAKLPLEHSLIERDWSIAAVLERADREITREGANRTFALVIYVLYPGIGIGILSSFFLVLVGVGMFFMPGVAQKYGLAIIPNLRSDDDRRGFEVFGRFFGNAVSVTALCFCFCYLMSLQNVYLRVAEPTLSGFLTPHPAEALSLASRGRVGAAIEQLVGNTLSGQIPGSSLQSLLAWFVLLVLSITLLGVAYLFLRASALEGRRRVAKELERYGMARLKRLILAPREEVEGRLATMKTWPLSWPQLNQTMIGAGLLVLSLVFYKLGMLVTALAFVFVVYNTFHAFRT